MLYCNENVNEVYDIFETNVNSCYDVSFTMVKVKQQADSMIWLTPPLIKSINTKCFLYEKKGKIKKAKDENKYKGLCKKITKLTSQGRETLCL